MVTRKKLQIITIVCWVVVIIIELLELLGIRPQEILKNRRLPDKCETNIIHFADISGSMMIVSKVRQSGTGVTVMSELSHAKKKANKKWNEKNKEKSRKYQYRSMAKSYVRNYADEKDLLDLKQMIEDKLDGKLQ